MRIENEIKSMLIQFRDSERVSHTHSYICSFGCFEYYADITGFLDGDYFNICVTRTFDKRLIDRNSVRAISKQKRKLKKYLKTITDLKFTTQI